MNKKSLQLPMLLAVGILIASSPNPLHASSFREVLSPSTTLQDGPPLTEVPSAVYAPVASSASRTTPESKSAFQTEIESEKKALRVQRMSVANATNGVSTVVSPITPGLPPLDDFIASVKSAQAADITGVYVPGVLALRVVPQPASRPTYVSFEFGVATLYCGHGPCKSIGLLAHNNLSGILFSILRRGQKVVVVRGDGSTTHYRVSSIRLFQALSPNDPYSSLVDLDNGATLSSGDLVQQIYGAGNQVVFQTCIGYEGKPTWGRLFVIADPASG